MNGVPGLFSNAAGSNFGLRPLSRVLAGELNGPEQVSLDLVRLARKDVYVGMRVGRYVCGYVGMYVMQCNVMYVCMSVCIGNDYLQSKFVLLEPSIVYTVGGFQDFNRVFGIQQWV